MRRGPSMIFVAAGSLLWGGIACTLTRSLDQYDEGPSSQPGADAAPGDVDGSKEEAGCLLNFADCDGDPANGCETDTLTNVEHCGGCDLPCTASSGQLACVGGTCQVTSCPAGWADCNASASDGCEADTNLSMDHCGGCARPCPPPNATSSACNAGACDFVCQPGFGDCDGLGDNGCEAELATDPEHCGICIRACQAPENAYGVCHDGLTCSWECEDLAGDCDFNPFNGCETSLASDPDACGACNNECPWQFTCESGTCSCVHNEDCDEGGGGKCVASGSVKVCQCDGVLCEPGEICLPSGKCSQN